MAKLFTFIKVIICCRIFDILAEVLLSSTHTGREGANVVEVELS